MPYYDNSRQFEPSKNAVSEWKKTRKKKYPIGDLVLEGILDTHTANDKVWFLIAVGIEIAALATTLYGGFSKGGIYALLGGAAVIFFIALDYFGMMLHHSKSGELCDLKNQKVAHPKLRVQYDREIRRVIWHWKRIVGVIFFILSAAIKIFAMLIFLKSNSPITWIVFAILYILVIYIHSFHTGYYWFYQFVVKKMFRKEHQIWSRESIEHNANMRALDEISYRAIPKPQPFECELNITEQNPRDGAIISYEDHVIKKGAKDNEYILETTGILRDSHVVNLCGGQNSNVQNTIALACLRHQIQQMGSNQGARQANFQK